MQNIPIKTSWKLCFQVVRGANSKMSISNRKQDSSEKFVKFFKTFSRTHLKQHLWRSIYYVGARKDFHLHSCKNWSYLFLINLQNVQRKILNLVKIYFICVSGSFVRNAFSRNVERLCVRASRVTISSAAGLFWQLDLS